jgi:hypothetical protein
MAGSLEMGLPRKELFEAEPSIRHVGLEFRPTCLSPPHGLGGFPLAYAGNPVISLVSQAPAIGQGPAERRWVTLAPLDQLAGEPCRHKVLASM